MMFNHFDITVETNHGILKFYKILLPKISAY